MGQSLQWGNGSEGARENVREGPGPGGGDGKRELCGDSLNEAEMGVKWEGEWGMAKAWGAGHSRGVRRDERKRSLP